MKNWSVDSFKTKILLFLRFFVQNTLKNQVLTVYYFSFTLYYLLFVFCTIAAFFSKVDHSYIQIVCQSIVFYSILSSLMLFLLLIVPFTRKKVEILLGKQFLNEKITGKFKSVLPLLIFLVTFSTLDLIEAVSMSLRVQSQIKCKDLLYQESHDLPLDQKNIDQASEFLTKLLNQSEEFASTGVITDISNWICGII